MNNHILKDRLIALIGNPLGQTFSPMIHNAVFKINSDKLHYFPFEVATDDISDAINSVRVLNFGGCNITKPFKIDVIKYLDELDESAKWIGSVNTVKNVDSKLVGYNTDGLGFVISLEEEHGVKVSDNTFFLHGCGGAGRSVGFYLAKYGAKKLVLSSQDDSAEILVDDLKTYGYTEVKLAPHTGVDEGVRGSSVYINATGIGMYDSVDESPIDTALFKEGQIVCDLTYNPAKTKLLIDAEKKKCKVINGKKMLIYQAALGYAVWNDVDAPIELYKSVFRELNI